MKNIFKSLSLFLGAITAVSAYGMDSQNPTLLRQGSEGQAPARDKHGDVKITTQTAGLLNALDQCGAHFRDPNFHSYAPRNEQTLYACMMIKLNDKPLSGIFGYTWEVNRLMSKYDRMNDTKKYKNRDTFLLTAVELEKAGRQCSDQDAKKCEEQIKTSQYIFDLLKAAHEEDAKK